MRWAWHAKPVQNGRTEANLAGEAGVAPTRRRREGLFTGYPPMVAGFLGVFLLLAGVNFRHGGLPVTILVTG